MTERGSRVPSDLLDALTQPRAVALVGASGTAGRVTARPLAFLRKHGFAGRIHPVNPGRDEIDGVRAWPSLEAVPEAVEHAYILLDAPLVPEVIGQCSRAGVKVVSVLASGFAETGPEGMAAQQRLAELASEAGVLLIGPNSMGVADTRSGFVCTTNAAFATESLPRGRQAVLSQSGSLMGALLSRGEAVGAGFSTFVSVGNEAQSGVARIGDLLLADPVTDSIVLCLETIRDPDGFAAFAERARCAGKPLFAYLLGRSQEAQALAVSHTGALTGAAEALEGFLDSCGVHRLDLFEALVEAPPAVAALAPRLADRPRKVIVLATTGGGGAMVIDRLAGAGVPLGGCNARVREDLARAGVSVGDGPLVDVTLAGANCETMRSVVAALAGDPGTGAVVVVVGSSARFDPERAVTPVIEAVAELGAGAAPVLAFPVPDAPESLRLFNHAGIPAFRTVESCAEALRCLFAAPVPPRPSALAADPEVARHLARHDGGVLDEVASREILQAAGVPSPPSLLLAGDARAPAELPFPYPVAAKVVSPDLPHKTEAGIVALDVRDREALNAELERLHVNARTKAPGARVRGVMVAPMMRGVAEVLVGLSRDPRVGPVVTVGSGGVLAELCRDTVVRPAPVDEAGAAAMLAHLYVAALLRGFRGRPEGDEAALTAAIAALSRLALYPRVLEAEINPLLVLSKGKGVVALDALVRLAPATVR